MGSELVPSDVAILDLLRKRDALTVAEMAEAMEVTATAVRQRLTRLLAQGFIERKACREGRGRPTHHYRLTPQGRRKTGSNFADLAIALWQEIRAIADLEVRRGLLLRISRRLAGLYGDRVKGQTIEARMESLAALMNEKQIPFEVREKGALPVLSALACPFPELADADRSVCAMERAFLTEMLGQNVRLGECRLDGGQCCTFELAERPARVAVEPPAG